MNAKEILAVPIEHPELLFRDPHTIKQDYKKFAAVWHPDKRTGDSDVFAHINELHIHAESKTGSGAWDNGTVLSLITNTSKFFRMPYKFKYAFELGTYYVNTKSVLYLINKEHKAFFDNACLQQKLTLPAKVADEMSKFLPKVKTTLELAGYYVLVLEKTPDVVPLRWVVQRFKKVPPKQAAWMTSAILNLCCCLQVAGVAHNDISLDSVFVSIKHHGGLLLGGWWYSGKVGHAMKHLPVRTYGILPHKIKTAKKHDITTSITSGKATIMEALGNVSGTKLRTDKDIPEAFVNWLLAPSGSEPVPEYRRWKSEVLPAMGYKPEFILWDIPQEQLLT